jgi:hypothetical protein
MKSLPFSLLANSIYLTTDSPIHQLARPDEFSPAYYSAIAEAPLQPAHRGL